MGITLVPQLEIMYKAIQAEFKKMVAVCHCRHRWLQDYKLVAIINHEYDIPSNKKIKYAQLNQALQGDKYSRNPEQANEDGLYKNVKTPAHFPDGRLNNKSNIKCYYATDLNTKPAG